MCVICRKEYDQNTTKIICCKRINEIPILPKLEYLDCTNTQIKEIPLLPNLQRLDCSNTRIAEIPLLPELEYLDCGHTRITEIPLLPKIKYLDCDNTQITEILILPELQKLHCYNTQITEIPLLKDCKINYNSCKWLNPLKERISLVGKIQNKISTVNQQRINLLFNNIDTYTDLLHIIKQY